MTDRATHDRPLWPSDEDRRWAYDVLGVPVDAEPARARAAALTRIEEAGFVPPPQWEQAILLLAGEPPRELWSRDQGEEMLRPREIALKKEMNNLAEAFFTLPPAQRHTRWKALTGASAFSLPLTAQFGSAGRTAWTCRRRPRAIRRCPPSG